MRKTTFRKFPAWMESKYDDKAGRFKRGEVIWFDPQRTGSNRSLVGPEAVAASIEYAEVMRRHYNGAIHRVDEDFDKQDQIASAAEAVRKPPRPTPQIDPLPGMGPLGVSKPQTIDISSAIAEAIEQTL
jgi:hypothetical protein